MDNIPEENIKRHKYLSAGHVYVRDSDGVKPL